MKTVKKLCALLFALTLAAALSVPAFADMIWQPGDFIAREGFFYEHQAECVYVRFEAGYAQEETELYSDPEELRVVRTVPAGTEVGVRWIWKDAAGEKWGLAIDEDEYIDGFWVRLKNFRRPYTEDDFFQDHPGETINERGEFHAAGQTAHLYRFPGSGKGDYPAVAEQDYGYYRTYTDENGLKWARVKLSGQYDAAWVCLSDPYTEQPRTAPQYSERAWPEPPEPVTEPEPTVEPAQPEQVAEPPAPVPEPVAPAPAAEQASPVGLIAGLVAAAVAASAALLLILRRKKRD